MTEKVRIATLNCENLFSRPKIFRASNADELLAAVEKLNRELHKAHFNQDKIRVLKERLKNYVTITDVKGKHTSAEGAGDWLGWIELKRQREKDDAIQNTARVLADIDADIMCLAEIESRPVLQRFHDDLLNSDFLKPASKQGYPYILLIDGNDSRGIDVALLSRRPLVSVQTHMFETTEYLGRTVNTFSRDCLNVGIDLGGRTLTVLVNHFKSMGYSPEADPFSNQRRYSQAKRVAEMLDTYSLTSDYVAVAGDLNSEPDSWSLRPLLEHDDLYNVNLELPTDQRGTYRTGNKQLDYLLVSSALRQKLSSVHIERRGTYARSKWQPYDTVVSRATGASDHCAVVADFEL